MDGMIRFALGSAYLSNIMISIKSEGNVKIIIDYCNRKSITGEIIKSFHRDFYLIGRIRGRMIIIIIYKAHKRIKIC